MNKVFINVSSFLIIVIIITGCSGFKTLIAIPTAIKSLHGLFASIAYGLADHGHHVTLISPYPLPKQHPNIETYTVVKLVPLVEGIKIFELRSLNNISTLMHEILPRYVHTFFKDEIIMEIWGRRNNFDMFITLSYYTELVFPFLMDSKATFVQVCTPGVESTSLSREGNWLTPAVAPSILNHYDEYMTFWERVLNLPQTISYSYFQKSAIKFYANDLQKYFPDFDDKESYYDRVALTLINGHFALDGPVPLLPSQIEIGTINAKKARPLEQVDMIIAEFVNASGDAGIVYFSLGSIAKGTDIPKEAKDVFVEAFRRIPQRVLWKYEIDDLDLPPNVMTSNWMPQQDILGHPKIRVFISHCGNLGTQEAKYHGVPVLGLPIAFDQPRNAARMERKGYALVIRWEELTVDLFLEKLNILINDKTYHERLKNLSRILQDQKDTPLERAIWWLEYVVRHNGAPHLNYAGRRLSLFQYIMLDVLLFWFGVMVAFVLVVVCAFRVICCRKKGQPVKETKKLEKKKKQ